MLGPSWGQLGVQIWNLDPTWEVNADYIDFEAARGTLFCRQGLPKEPPEAPMVTKRAPGVVPERSKREDKSEKNENYDTLILNDPMGV